MASYHRVDPGKIRPRFQGCPYSDDPRLLHRPNGDVSALPVRENSRSFALSQSV